MSNLKIKYQFLGNENDNKNSEFSKLKYFINL